MNREAVDFLVCPHCGGGLRQNGASLICSRGHTSNVARQGYVSLLGRHAGTHTADSAEMVEARGRVLGAGLFEPLAVVISGAVADPGLDLVEGAVVDLGSGPGFYLDRVLQANPERIGIAIDNSKFAARRAARSNARAGAVVADIWDGIPVRTDAAAVVMNVFAPRNGEEIERILAPGGRLVVVTPESGHLEQLVAAFSMISVDEDKTERLRSTLGDLATGLSGRPLDWKMEVNRDQVKDLVGMGPSAGRMAEAEFEAAIAALPEQTEVTASVMVWTATVPAP